LLRYILPPLAVILIVLASLCLIVAAYQKVKTKNVTQIGSLGFDDHRAFLNLELVHATCNFNEANFLRRRSSGSVFKGSVDDV